MGSVYWIGADGNVWLNGQNQGKPINLTDNGFDAQWSSAEATRIADPNPPQQEAPSVASGGGGGGDSGPNRVLNQAAVDNTHKAISSLDDELGVGYGNIEDNFGSIIGRYDKERSRNKADYDEETVTNTTNLQKNKQNALVSGAQGLRGLRGVLASIGALSGDGGTLANRAVTTEANRDIGGATDTYAGNAQNLDKAWTRFDEEDDDRRREAKTAKANQRTALEGSILEKRQNYFQKLAELFGEVDNIGEAEKWLNRSGDLNDDIARKSRVAATPFTAKAAAYTPEDLANYLAGAGDMTVEVRGGDQSVNGPTGVFAGRRESEEERRRKRAPVPLAA